MKRHGFHGLRASHGVSISHRSTVPPVPTRDPVVSGQAPRWPVAWVETSTHHPQLLVVRVDAEKDLIYVKGNVPGPKGGNVTLQDARRPSWKGQKMFRRGRLPTGVRRCPARRPTRSTWRRVWTSCLSPLVQRLLQTSFLPSSRLASRSFPRRTRHDRHSALVQALSSSCPHAFLCTLALPHKHHVTYTMTASLKMRLNCSTARCKVKDLTAIEASEERILGSNIGSVSFFLVSIPRFSMT